MFTREAGILQALFAKMDSVFSPKNRYFDWQDYTGIKPKPRPTHMPKQTIFDDGKR
jgi:hypothetical protein